MTFGFSLNKPTGEIQIDGEYSNFALLQSGSFTATSGWEANSLYNGVSGAKVTTVSFQPQVAPPLICFGNTDGAAISLLQVTSSSFSIITSVTKTISYKIYTPQSNLGSPEGTHGFLVFGMNGDVVFDSRITPLKITQKEYAARTAFTANTVFGKPIDEFVGLTGMFVRSGVITQWPSAARYVCPSVQISASTVTVADIELASAPVITQNVYTPFGVVEIPFCSVR